MNSEHIKENQTFQYIVNKYNIEQYKYLKNHTCCFRIFNGYIESDIYNLKNTLDVYEKTKQLISDENEILLDTYIKNNNIWLKIQSYNGDIYDINLKGYKKMIASRHNFIDTVNRNNHILLTTYINAKQKVLIDYCCGHPANFVTPNSYLQGTRCPYCSHKFTEKHINDCYTLRKDLLKYFIDEKDAIGMASSDRTIKMYKCPKCGAIRKNTLGNINTFGFSCYTCGDGISYPEKMMKQILEDISVPFLIHDSPSWCKFIFDGKEHFGIYDFVIPTVKTIIEMDGAFHNKKHYFSIVSQEYLFNVDRIKDSLAVKNGYQIIRIDCDYGKTFNRFSYIKNNIINSLDTILGLDMYNWEELKNKLETEDSLLMHSCKLWNDGKSVTEISRIMNLSRCTILNYLKRGVSVGLCDYNKEISMHRRTMN